MSDPLGHILDLYFADVLIESGYDDHDGPFGHHVSAKNRNHIKQNYSTNGLLRSTYAVQQCGYDMVDGQNNKEETMDSDQMRKLEEIALTLAKIGDNVNERYNFPEWNPNFSFDRQIDGLLAERVDQSDVQQVALVLRFAKDVLKTAVNKQGILNETKTYISRHFSGWISGL
ncbi:uncharacterized protein LOC117124292 [Anneissia japonica]|uniref:uncharacterized protein LOC117124292 n=1 Tax=Anneissia japonica TaxID=1529436 RepID=UPI001425B3AE|nr:uncharacterized protein LOC117124292 [Anneissia japonica]